MTADLLRSLCPTESVFERGLWMARTRRVRNVQCLNDHAVQLHVEDFHARQSVHLEWQDGMIHSARCSCGEQGSIESPCSHIVAAILNIESVERLNVISLKAARDNARHLIDALAPPPPGSATVTLQVMLKLPDYVLTHGTEISLRIGTARLYVVQNITKLLESVVYGREQHFGKWFTYLPGEHRFLPEDKAILDILSDVVLPKRERFDGVYGGHYNGASSARSLQLDDGVFRRLMEYIAPKGFSLIYNKLLGDSNEDFNGGTKLIPPVVEGAPELRFELLPRREDTELIFTHGQLQTLTRDARYVLCEDTLYHLSEVQAELLRPFLDTRFGNRYIIEPELFPEFIGTVYGRLGQLGEVALDPELEKRIERRTLQSRVYLDMVSGELVARVEFQYDEDVINPWSPLKKSQRALLRDLEGEQAVMRHFEQLHFTVRPDGAHLADPEELFHFLRESLPQIENVAELFATDAVRRSFTQKLRPGAKLSYRKGLLEFRLLLENAPEIDTGDVLDALRAHKRYVRIASGEFLELEGEGWEDVANLLAQAGTPTAEGTIELPLYHALGFSAWMESLGFSMDAQLQSTVQALTRLDAIVPGGLADVLRGYQKTGFQWMAALTQGGMGCVLADDMGLGKTVQVITLIDWARERQGRKPSLVVCPTTLLFNWRAEIERFAPHLAVCTLEGTPQHRRQQADALDEYDVVITSYPLIRRDGELYAGRQFRYCILDEAQAIKNAFTLNAQSVKQIQAESRVAMTGTPIENNLGELWSIFDFILPGYLYTQPRFLSLYEGEGKLTALFDRIRPFLLRRLKKDVLGELPDKIEQTISAEMTAEQRAVYEATLARVREEFEQDVSDKGNAERFQVLAAITRLRQICCHPSLCFDGYVGGSGKIELLLELIEESISGGHSILLFSQFTSMLAVIRKQLQKRDINTLYLDGHTPSNQREQLVRAFNDGGAPIFLISLKAGGTGLNLTRADMVIHYDPWWNPAVEDQATDRAHRIGQTHAVQVIRLIARNSIEENIMKLKEKKQVLIDSVIGQSDGEVAKVSLEELRALFY